MPHNNWEICQDLDSVSISAIKSNVVLIQQDMFIPESEMSLFITKDGYIDHSAQEEEFYEELLMDEQRTWFSEHFGEAFLLVEIQS